MLVDLIDHPWVHLVLFFVLLQFFLLFLEVLLGRRIELSLKIEVFLELLDLAIVVQGLLLNSYNFIVFIFQL